MTVVSIPSLFRIKAFLKLSYIQAHYLHEDSYNCLTKDFILGVVGHLAESMTHKFGL